MTDIGEEIEISLGQFYFLFLFYISFSLSIFSASVFDIVLKCK